MYVLREHIDLINAVQMSKILKVTNLLLLQPASLLSIILWNVWHYQKQADFKTTQIYHFYLFLSVSKY